MAKLDFAKRFMIQVDDNTINFSKRWDKQWRQFVVDAEPFDDFGIYSDKHRFESLSKIVGHCFEVASWDPGDLVTPE